MPDLRAALHLIGLLVAALGATMAAPMLADLIEGDPNWRAFALAGFFSVLVGALLAAAGGADRASLSVQETFLLTTLCWLLLPVFAGIAVSAFLVPSEQGERKPPAPKGSLKAIVMHPAVVAFFLMNFLLQVSHGAYYTFFSIHLAQHGYGKLSIGLLWSLGVIAEIGLFLVMHRLSRRFSVRQIAIGALTLTMIRWVLIAEVTDVLAVLIFAQCLHAASYGALHALSVQYIQGFFGKHHHGQGQALYSGLTFGAGGALGAWMSGFLVMVSAPRLRSGAVPLPCWLPSSLPGGG